MSRAAGPCLLLLLTLEAACGQLRVPPPENLRTDPGEVLSQVRARAEGLESLAAYARASHYSDEGAFKGMMDVVVRRPASLHFSAMTPTDQWVPGLVSDGEVFTSFERGGGVCYVGASCPRNVGRLLSIEMAGADIAGVLLGSPPILPHERLELSWDAEVGAYRLHLVASKTEQVIWVRHDSGDVLRTLVREGARRLFDIQWDDVRTVDGRRLPHTIHLKMDRGDVDLKLKYRDVTLNGDVADDAFKMVCPEGTRVQTLSCERLSPQGS